jgi:hypothetical protein
VTAPRGFLDLMTTAQLVNQDRAGQGDYCSGCCRR